MTLFRKLATLGIFAVVSIVFIRTAAAWNRAGHMTTAAIAYDVLAQENPQALAKTVELLKQHPQYTSRWARRLEQVDPADRDQALFMMAARWPDDIRSDPDYDHPVWHYIDYPYKPPGQPASVETAPPPEPNIEMGFRENVGVLKGTGTNADKAVALCWVFHLIGDSHQPLHSVSLFTTDYPAPKGDQGGNKIFIRARSDSDPINLHAFWDNLVIGSEDTREVRKKAIELRNQYPRAELDPQPQIVTPVDLPTWIPESFELAKSVTYLEGKLPMSPVREKAPVLPEDYLRQSKIVGERRATQAGYRLADVLVQVVAGAQ